jgi:AcrR family transcriptional regulator
MNTAGTTQKKGYHHGDLRKALLEAAAKLLREDGETGLSMRNLAASAGVSRTAAYHHFNDKQDLLCAIAEEGFRQFRRIFRPAGDADDGSVQQAHIQRFVTDYIAFATDHSEYYELMFGSRLWQSGQLSDTLRQEAYISFRVYVNRIRKWQEQGDISRSLDPLRYAQVTWSTLHGMSRLLIDGIYVDGRSRNAMCKAAAEMLWRELTTK